MTDRALDAAFGVLKGHAKRIKIERRGDLQMDDISYELIVRGLRPGTTAFEEVESALYTVQEALIKDASIVIDGDDGNDPRNLVVKSQAHAFGDSRSDIPVRHPVDYLATVLADNGVNFPGSEAHRTKEKK